MLTLRDGIALMVGACISLALALGSTARDPGKFLTWALVVCGVLLVALIVADLARGPWVSVEITPIDKIGGGTVLRLGFRNHGMRDFGRVIANVLMPDSVVIDRHPADQQPVNVLRTSESVDGEHESIYWNSTLDLAQGVQLAHVVVIARDQTQVPMCVNLRDVRRSLTVNLERIGTTHTVDFGSVRPWVARRFTRIAGRPDR